VDIENDSNACTHFDEPVEKDVAVDSFQEQSGSMAAASKGPDVRWKQRLHSFQKAFVQLRNAVKLNGERKLSELEQQGVVKAFEFTHELAWTTLKDYLEDQGETKLRGSKDVTRRAFKFELIENGQAWMDMIESRNRSVHSYDENMASELAGLVIRVYFPVFEEFEKLFLAIEKESA
jgi:nucleotidyltransferase substrate binding protein (TIGR01987 family)